MHTEVELEFESQVNYIFKHVFYISSENDLNERGKVGCSKTAEL